MIASLISPRRRTRRASAVVRDVFEGARRLALRTASACLLACLGWASGLRAQAAAATLADSLLVAVRASTLAENDGADVFRLGGAAVAYLVAVGSSARESGAPSAVRRVAEMKARREAVGYLRGVHVEAVQTDVMQSSGGRETQEITSRLNERVEGQLAELRVLGSWASRDGQLVYVAVYRGVAP